MSRESIIISRKMTTTQPKQNVNISHEIMENSTSGNTSYQKGKIVIEYIFKQIIRKLKLFVKVKHGSHRPTVACPWLSNNEAWSPAKTCPKRNVV
jgi:hypothetical protein